MNDKVFEIKEEAAFGPGGERWIYTIYHKDTKKVMGSFKNPTDAEIRMASLQKAYDLGKEKGRTETAAFYKFILFIIIAVIFVIFGIAVKSNIGTY